MASDNKTTAEFGRSGVYRLNNSSGAMGNSYGAQLEYMNSKTGENAIDNVRDIGASKSKTNLNASKISISHENKESSDYHADESSVTADYDTQRGEMPQWRKLLLDPEKAGYFLSRQWPRISLRSSFRSKEPYIVPNEEDKNSIQKGENQQRNNCKVYVMICLAILVILAIIPTIVISILSKNADPSTGKSYVKANMILKIDSAYNDAYSNSQSPEYITFGNQFCIKIGNVFANGILESYYGCRVTNLTRGSVVVAFVAYFNETSLQHVTKEKVEKQFADYFKKSNYSLDKFVVVENSTHVIDIVIEILTSPPSIQNIQIDAKPTLATPFETPVSFHTRAITSNVGSNISQTPSVFDIYMNVDTSFTSFFESKTTPMLKRNEISSVNTGQSEIFSSVSLQFSTIIDENGKFTKGFMSLSASLIPTVSNNATIGIPTTLSDSIDITSTRYLTETPFGGYSTLDVSKITNSLLTSLHIINANAFSSLMSENSFYVPQSTTSNASSIVVKRSSYTENSLFTYISQPMTTVATPFVRINHDFDSEVLTSISQSITTGVTSYVLGSSYESDIAVSFYVSQSMTKDATSFELTNIHSSDIEVSYVPQSMTTVVTSFVLSTDYTITSSYYFPQSKMTVTTTANIESIPNTSTADVYSSFTESKANRINSSNDCCTLISWTPILSKVTSVGDLIYTSNSLPSSSNSKGDIIYSTISVPFTVSDNVPSKSSSDSGESLKVTKSQMKASEGLSVLTTVPGNILISTVDSTTKPISVFPTKTTESAIGQPSQTTAKSMTIQASSQESYYFSELDLIQTSIIEKGKYNTYSMAKTEIMSQLQSSYETSIITFLDASNVFSKIISSLTELNHVSEVTPTVTSRGVTFLSLPVSYSSTTSPQSSSSVLATETPIQDFRCNNITGELYKGPVLMTCILGSRLDFDKIAISHVIDNNILFAVELHKNGSRNYLKSDPNISATFDVSQVNITFLNVSCQMDGIYNAFLVNSSNYLMERTFGHLIVASPPEIPTLTLNADQVIDLVFKDGNYYRGERTHVCEGNIGHPPGSLAVDILYVNKSTFESIPENSYKNISSNKIMSQCSNRERIEFAIKFSEEMQGAILRCRVPGAFNNGTVQQLTLIPRNFCSCAKPDTLYEHPTRCDAVVQCILDNQIMYPFGLQCSPDKCSNSTTGICSHNCSQHDCNKAKPTDLCIPPTATPDYSAYISYNESVFAMLSSEIDISYTLNQTSQFGSINISKLSTQNSIKEIAQISRERTVIKRTTDDNLNVTFVKNIITISLSNVSCTDEGTYSVLMDVYSEVVKAATHLSVFQKPNVVPVLKLDADQIADLGTYRSWLLHSCISQTGYPASQMEIEILLKGENNFTMVYNTDNVVPIDETTNCVKTRKIEFGIKFTSNMTGAIIRCSVQNDHGRIYSNNETVSLIPYNFCENNTNLRSFYPHPDDCSKFVQCEQKLTYGKKCPSGLCFGTNSLNKCDYCTAVHCFNLTIQPTTETPQTSIAAKNTEDIFCSESLLVMLHAKQVPISCRLNKTAFESINITKVSHNSTLDIARILPDGTVVQIYSDVNLNITFAIGVLTITVNNVTCADVGVYIVSVHINGTKVEAQTNLSVIQEPNGYAVLTLNTDQHLGYYSPFYLHSCRADIGYPPGKVEVEIIKKGQAEFSLLNVNTSFSESNINCTTIRNLRFGIVFSSDMDSAVIRCRIMFQNNPPIYSNNETVSLLPDNICDNSTSLIYYKPHPTDCFRYFRCERTTAYGLPCDYGYCFGHTSVNYCKDECNEANCRTTTILETDERFRTTTSNSQP